MIPPMYIKRLSCLRERKIKFKIHSQLSFTQQGLKLNSLDYSIRICHNSHQGLDHFDYIIRVCLSYFIKLTSGSQRLRISFEEYVEYFLHCTNLEVKFLCLYFIFESR